MGSMWAYSRGKTVVPQRSQSRHFMQRAKENVSLLMLFSIFYLNCVYYYLPERFFKTRAVKSREFCVGTFCYQR